LSAIHPCIGRHRAARDKEKLGAEKERDTEK
jgi:hypothetical protein